MQEKYIKHNFHIFVNLSFSLLRKTEETSATKPRTAQEGPEHRKKKKETKEQHTRQCFESSMIDPNIMFLRHFGDFTYVLA